MRLKTLEVGETHLLYTDPGLFALMQIALPGAEIGKVKSVAEALYTNFKSRMYLLEGEADQGTIGLIGLSKAQKGVAEIQHFALAAEVDQLQLAKEAFAELRESRRDLTEIWIRVAHDRSKFFKMLGFNVKKYPDNPYGLEGDLCTLRF